MKGFSVDIKEITSILSSAFDIDVPDSRGWILVSERMGRDIKNDYLQQRGHDIKIAAKSYSKLQKHFSVLFTEVCKEKKCDICPVSKYCNDNIYSKIKHFDKNSPVIVDLFCGAGGMSLGFTQSGFITSLANDVEPSCIDTYSHNHPETPRENIILGNINELIGDIESLLRFKEVDVVIGGPPCQGFSMANRQRLIDDPRNNLYKSYVQVVGLVKPKYFVMENVKGMLSAAPQVKEDFERVGYSVSYQILNAKDFGVPQNRERLIFIGNRIGADNEQIFKNIIKESKLLPSFVLDDALWGLKRLSASTKKNSTEIDSETSGKKIDRSTCSKSSEYLSLINNGNDNSVVFNHKARYNNDRDIEIFGRLNPGDKSDDPKIADIMPYANRNHIFKDKYYKLEGNKVCKTITAHMKFDCNMYIHPYQARGLTPREAARVQSFPDDYYFRGAYTKTYLQIGNSVPPLLGRAIAKEIYKQLKKGV